MSHAQAASIVDTAAFEQRFAMPDHGGRHDHHASARELRAPAEVDVVAAQRDLGVVAADGPEQVGAHHRATARHREDIRDGIVLFLVELALLDDRRRDTELVDGETDVLEPGGVVPIDHLRTDDRRVRSQHLFDQPAHRVGVQGDVVVAEQIERSTQPVVEHDVGRGTESPVLGVTDDRRLRKDRLHASRDVFGAGLVDHQHGQAAVVLLRKALERVVE
jgi:hypothetical protein